MAILSALVSLALLVANVAADSMEIDPRLSFGRQLPISPDHRNIHNWHTIGTPKILSDRVLLTDMHVPHQRNALWSDHKNERSEWGATFRFLGTGEDGGSGNLNLWYVKDGSRAIQASSVYQAPAFDGLAIVIDHDPGQGGTVRGFLNDGNTDYKHHHHVDSLAFGACQFHYRNTHRIALISIKQTNEYLEVLTDGLTCFKSDRIRLPPGYQFGVTANTAEKPDIFEALSFLVLPNAGQIHANGQAPADSHAHMHDPYAPWGGTAHQAALQAQLADPNFHQMFHAQQMNQMPDQNAQNIHGQEDQFSDLHGRMQHMQHMIVQFYDEMVKFAQAVEGHQKDLIQVLGSTLINKDDAKRMHASVEVIEHLVHDIKANTYDNDYKFKFDNMHEAVMSHHKSLMMDLPEHLHGLLLHSHSHVRVLAFYIFLFQCILVASYVVYKRRKNSQPKKYV